VSCEEALALVGRIRELAQGARATSHEYRRQMPNEEGLELVNAKSARKQPSGASFRSTSARTRLTRDPGG